LKRQHYKLHNKS